MFHVSPITYGTLFLGQSYAASEFLSSFWFAMSYCRIIKATGKMKIQEQEALLKNVNMSETSLLPVTLFNPKKMV